jgi:hypothetical protein
MTYTLRVKVLYIKNKISNIKGISRKFFIESKGFIYVSTLTNKKDKKTPKFNPLEKYENNLS